MPDLWENTNTLNCWPISLAPKIEFTLPLLANPSCWLSLRRRSNQVRTLQNYGKWSKIKAMLKEKIVTNLSSLSLCGLVNWLSSLARPAVAKCHKLEWLKWINAQFWSLKWKHTQGQFLLSAMKTVCFCCISLLSFWVFWLLLWGPGLQEQHPNPYSHCHLTFFLSALTKALPFNRTLVTLD